MVHLGAKYFHQQAWKVVLYLPHPLQKEFPHLCVVMYFSTYTYRKLPTVPKMELLQRQRSDFYTCFC